MVGYALFRDLPNRWAAVAASLVVAAVVWAVPKPWLRVLLGAAAALLVGLAVAPLRWSFLGRSEGPSVWLALHVLLAGALLGAWVQRNVLNRGEDARVAAAWESLSVGWLLVTLAEVVAEGMEGLVIVGLLERVDGRFTVTDRGRETLTRRLAELDLA